MFCIQLTPEALDDLGSMPTFDARRVVAAVESQLSHEPTQETRNRKRPRPNGLAEWELRVDVFRVFYDVDDETVSIVAIGLKQGNQLFIHGERYEL
ncbi:MAG: type II toxin-antitoxin system RelE family toxin [Isosphaeraceae bacterium]